MAVGRGRKERTRRREAQPGRHIGPGWTRSGTVGRRRPEKVWGGGGGRKKSPRLEGLAQLLHTRSVQQSVRAILGSCVWPVHQEATNKLVSARLLYHSPHLTSELPMAACCVPRRGPRALKRVGVTSCTEGSSTWHPTRKNRRGDELANLLSGCRSITRSAFQVLPFFSQFPSEPRQRGKDLGAIEAF